MANFSIRFKGLLNIVEIAPIQDNQPVDKIEQLNLNELTENKRFQTIILSASVRINETLGKSWRGDPASHISQLKDYLKNL